MTDLTFDNVDTTVDNLNDADFDVLFTPDAINAVKSGKATEFETQAENAYLDKLAKKAKQEHEFSWDEPSEEDIDDATSPFDEGDARDLEHTETELDEDGLTKNPVEFFGHLDDDVEIAPGYTKGVVKQMMNEREDFNQKAEFMNQQYMNYDKNLEYIRGILGTNITETNKTIQAIQKALDHPSTDTVRRGQLYQELRNYETKRKDIENSWKEVEQANKQQEAMLNEQRFFNTDNAMKQKYGKDWDSSAALTYAVQHGIAIPDLERTISPALMDIVMKAMRHDNLKATKQQALSNNVAKAARSSSSTKPNQTRGEGTSVKQREAQKKAANGDWGDMFSYLTD